MKDEFIITLLNNKTYNVKDNKETKKKLKEKRKYVSDIDEKICNWKKK